MKHKQFSSQTIKGMKDTLSTIFWYKRSLIDFIRHSMDDGYKLLSSIDTITLTKRDIASSFVEKLILNQNIYQEDIIHIVDQLCNWTDFTELSKLDLKEQIKEAKEHIHNLKGIAQGFFDKKISEQKQKEAQDRYQKNLEYRQYFLDELEKLKNEYMKIFSINPQEAGYIFEKILYKLNEIFDLDPRASYRIVGEQIDGSFSFENQEYLLEAKYCKDVIDHNHIILFVDKVNKKLENTLGLLISNNGFTETAINNANNKNILLMDGQDLFFVLEDRIDLRELLRYKKRHAAETGNSFYKVNDIIKNK